jgi:predicted RNA-binding Zn-ribbon protein involved in translation (DUF1610 family)
MSRNRQAQSAFNVRSATSSKGYAVTAVPIFTCPDCGSVYKVARLKTPPEPHDHPVGCLSCGRALAPREDGFLLKYFRVEKPNARPRQFEVSWAGAKR